MSFHPLLTLHLSEFEKQVHRIQKYIKVATTLSNMDKGLKQESLKYELWDGILYGSDLNTSVINDLNDFVATIESVQKDLCHYGKWTTLDAVCQ